MDVIYFVVPVVFVGILFDAEGLVFLNA